LSKLNNVSIKVFNVTGKLLLSESGINVDVYQLNIGSELTGVYFVEISTVDRSQRYKILKE